MRSARGCARVAQDAARRWRPRGPRSIRAGAGREAWDGAGRDAAARGLASEVEVVDGDGAVAFSRRVAPVVHRPGEEERASRRRPQRDGVA
jgi:hypothetical protein